MNALRKSSGTNFPYYFDSNITYIEVKNNGEITFACACRKGDMRSLVDVISRVKRGESKLIASWPGKYRTEIFLIDELDKLLEEVKSI